MRRSCEQQLATAHESWIIRKPCHGLAQPTEFCDSAWHTELAAPSSCTQGSSKKKAFYARKRLKLDQFLALMGDTRDHQNSMTIAQQKIALKASQTSLKRVRGAPDPVTGGCLNCKPVKRQQRVYTCISLTSAPPQVIPMLTRGGRRAKMPAWRSS